MSATVAASRSAAHSTARASTRRLAVGRRTARPAPPRTPEGFYSEAAHALLTELFIARAQRWQASMPPICYYGRDSEPLWGDVALRPCSGTTIRIACQRVLYDCLCLDLERGLRLLTLAWTPDGQTTADGHTIEEWRCALAGVCWRVGQLYREVVRRKGEVEAQRVLRLAMDTLHG